MAKQTLAFDADVAEATAVNGFLTQLSRGMQTNRSLGAVVDAAHATMSNDFTMDMGALAVANPESYHHVYEWGEEHLGNPAQSSRLWNDVLRGRGAKRTATFEWRASVKTVPIPNIPPGPQGQQLRQIHVFVWKAPVMEYDLRVAVRPKKGDDGVVAFSTGDSDTPLWFSKTGIIFRPGRYQMSNGESRIRKSAGTVGTAGKFTTAYIAWWGGPAGELSFNRGVGVEISRDFSTLPISKVTAPFRRQPTKTFRLNVAANAQEAYSKGVAKAKTWLVDRDQKYYEMAKARRGNG